MSTTVGSHSGAGPLSLMSCVRESSPLQDYETDIEKNVVPKRKFWNPKKWFRKKQKTGEDTSTHTHHQEHRDADGSRSRSTGELSTDEEPSRSHQEVRNSTSMHPGLSVSHDSVFHPLNSGSSDLELDGAQSSSSLSISQPLGDAKLQTELSSRLRLRRGRGDTSEDDEGFPRSPLCGSPAATNDPFLILEKTANKDLPTKSHSTCSDGSLLSMDGSEMDEDSVGLQSRNSSKVSLNEKKIDPESDLELGLSFSTTPLNHSAAHHRVSVRPKRTYGAPRRKKGQLSSALPTTPEVNEESSTRSISPESIVTEPLSELYSRSALSIHKSLRHAATHETKLKSNSLPAGMTPPTSDSFRLGRSKSNAGKSQDDTVLPEEKLSLFERLFPRRSGKKKKKEEEKMRIVEVDGARTYEESKISHVFTRTVVTSPSHTPAKPMVAPRTGPSARQRIEPIDIPVTRKDFIVPKSPRSPEKSFSPGTSPLQAELESLLRQRQMSQLSESPPHSPKSPRVSLSSSKSPLASKKYTSYSSQTTEIKKEVSRTSTEDIRSKIKIAGLSSLQQRVLTLNATADDNDNFQSLTDFSIKSIKPVSKSHSFKSEKSPKEISLEEVVEEPSERRKSVNKAASLDSVKNLDEPTLKSELQFKLKPVKREVEKETEVEEIEVKEKKIDLKRDSPRTSETSITKPISKDPKMDLKGEGPRPNEFAISKSLSKDSNINLKGESPRSSETSISKSFSNDSITISGPSHTAVVNVTSKSEDFSTTSSSEKEVIDKDGSTTLLLKESQVSVTKIQLKQETTQVTKTSVVLPKNSLPEFLNKQLNKVETRPTSNIVFSMKSPKVSPEETQSARPKTVFTFPETEAKPQLPRKFSKEDVEIIEKGGSPPRTPTGGLDSPRFKKNDSKPSSRKSSVISIIPDSPGKESIKGRALKTRSISLDSLKSETSKDKSSQDSLDKMEKRSDSVVLRRRSLVKQKNDDEPELMKVFARRSLKLKDGEVDQLQEAIIAEEQRQRDSDKENNVEPKKKIPFPKEEKIVADEQVTKQPLTEIKKSSEIIKNMPKEEPEVQLRKSLNNNIFLVAQRATSLSSPKTTVVNEFHVKKQPLNEWRKAEQWITTKKEENSEERKSESEIITNVTIKTEEARTETKNFSQRRAEWEKRVQQAQK